MCTSGHLVRLDEGCGTEITGTCNPPVLDMVATRSPLYLVRNFLIWATAHWWNCMGQFILICWKKVFGGKHIPLFCSVYFTSTGFIMHDSHESVTNSNLRILGTWLKNDFEDISLRVKSGWCASSGKPGIDEKMSHIEMQHTWLWLRQTYNSS
jgi:hypothetical protein